MIRLFDLLFSLGALIIFSPILLGIFILGFLDTGSPLFRQERVGRFQKPFILYKFRTMRLETVSMGTHLVDASAITSFGLFLRRSKLDELPQLWNVLKGEMSMVGPRPCLFNQNELIDARAKYGVFDALPGITGLAQIQGVDMSNPGLLARTDAKMIKNLNIYNYMAYIFFTAIGRGYGDRVKAKP